ncbi:MAG: hypothetical protein WBA57_19065 [Elainellaceae cyanobacterium]
MAKFPEGLSLQEMGAIAQRLLHQISAMLSATQNLGVSLRIAASQRLDCVRQLIKRQKLVYV